MDNSQPNRKKLIVILLVMAVLVVVAIVFILSRGEKPANVGTSNGNSQVSRETIVKRRQAVMNIMSALENYAKENNGQFPDITEVNGALRQKLGSLPIDPSSQKAFTIQASPPSATHEIQYATRSICTDNLYALKKSSSRSDVAFLIQDQLTKFFCLSSRVNRER
jgi:hypothetical protein